MTNDQRAEINKQNASHSTGPKTEEGKAKVSQNAVTHGLTSQKPPQGNARFQQLLAGFQKDHHHPQSQTAQIWLQELAHIAWKLEQIPALEQQVEQESGLTLAEHFIQDKPTPLVKLWNLHLRLGGRFNSLTNKLKRHDDVQFDESPQCPVPPLQNKPTLGAPSSSSVPSSPPPPPPPKTPVLQNEPTPRFFTPLPPPSDSSTSTSAAPNFQNKANAYRAMVRKFLSSAIDEVQLPNLNP